MVTSFPPLPSKKLFLPKKTTLGNGRKLVKSLFWHHDPPFGRGGGRGLNKFFGQKIIFFQKWSEMAKKKVKSLFFKDQGPISRPFWDNLLLSFLLFNLRWAQLYVSLVSQNCHSDLYQHNQGYKLAIGSAQGATCVDGVWSPSEIPVCLPGSENYHCGDNYHDDYDKKLLQKIILRMIVNMMMLMLLVTM